MKSLAQHSDFSNDEAVVVRNLFSGKIELVLEKLRWDKKNQQNLPCPEKFLLS